MSEDTNNKSQGVAWFLAGLGVGALIGILYAPKSGRETREDLAQRAQDGKEYLRARSKEAAEQMGNMVDKGKEQMNQYIGRGRLDRQGPAQFSLLIHRTGLVPVRYAFLAWDRMREPDGVCAPVLQ